MTCLFDNGDVVKDFAGRYYLIQDGYLITPLGKRYRKIKNTDGLELRKARKKWSKVCKDWQPAGKLIRAKKNRNRPV